MAGSVNPPTRRYRSTLREEQAQRTRRTVVAVAHRLFVERGYSATTVAAVAAEAGVSAETIYASLGGKRGLLEGVIEATILGPESIPLLQQLARPRIEALENPHDRLAAFAEFVCQVLARTSPVHAVIRGAADGEEFAVALRQRLLDQRVKDIRSHLRFILPDGVRPWPQLEAGNRTIRRTGQPGAASPAHRGAGLDSAAVPRLAHRRGRQRSTRQLRRSDAIVAIANCSATWTAGRAEGPVRRS